MDIISAINKSGRIEGPPSSARHPQTVKRVVDEFEAGDAYHQRGPSELHNYDAMTELAVERSNGPKAEGRLDGCRHRPRRWLRRLGTQFPASGLHGEAVVAQRASPR